MKHLIRTYALGLLTATLIIGIYYFYFAEQDIVVEKIEMTEAEMVSSLEDAGYYIYETEPIVTDPEEVLIEDNPIDDQNDSEDDQMTDEFVNDEIDEPANSDNDSIILTIEPGMTVSQVADYLIAANIIDSRKELASYLIDHDYGTNIQIGQFELNREMTLGEIVEIIARQNE